jgi:Mrp family chromosome partitioning ATPase
VADDDRAVVGTETAEAAGDTVAPEPEKKAVGNESPAAGNAPGGSTQGVKKAPAKSSSGTRKRTSSKSTTKRGAKKPPRKKSSTSAGRWTGDVELPDGGLALVDTDGMLIQLAPAKVSGSLRYFLARLQREAADGRLPSRLAFTSALSGEGVSVMARSTAAILAHDSGRRVCLVDLNWWSFDRRTYRPSEEVHGLYEVLWMDKPIDAVMVATQSPGLMYLPAGKAPRSVRPMLARHPDLPDLLDRLATRFDHLVLDVPALLATSDALALSSLSDAVALVVQQGVATTSQLESAIADLGDDRPVGVVLNKTESSIPRPIRRLLGLS